MTNIELIILIALLALSMFVIRVFPVTLLANVTMPKIIEKWLKYIPPAILSAMVASEIFTKDSKLFISLSNHYLLVAIPTFLVAIKTKSLFFTLVFGMACMALLRFALPYI